jgi:hypothetical protein
LESALPLAAQDIDTKAAQASIEAWLALVDSEAYADSWTTAASGFKSRVGQQQWETMAKSARGPFGRLKERKLGKTTATRTVPGAPDGEYVIVQFNTAFEHKAAAVETATAVKDTDGAWRVAGYSIK